MPFSSLTNDSVTFVKADGSQVVKNIKCVVEPTKITSFEHTDLQYAIGDHLIRILPNKLGEDYLILRANYQSGFGSIPSHYTFDVRKSDEPVTQPQNIITHIHGNHNRLNVNSVDKSINSYSENDTAVFEELIAAIQKQGLDQDEATKLLNTVEQLKVAVGTPSYKTQYMQFIADIGAHMTILAPFLPVLTKFLGA